MIDTIILIIHNTKKYAQIANSLQKANSTNGISFLSNVDETTGEVFTHKKASAKFFHDRNSLVVKRYRDHLFVPSSHYNLLYDIDEEISSSNPDGRIIFNFSIPKYKYATNLLQFVNYYDQSPEKVWSMLNQFIKDFKKRFIQKVDDFDMEIERLDLCYNQFFRSKQDAMDYLTQQKILASKHNESRHVHFYPTSLMIKNRRMSFKIYHKGEEFAQKDAKQLMKIEPSPYPVEEFKQIADRCLRYECTFRNTWLNYVFYQRYVERAEKDNTSIYHYLLAVKKIDGVSRMIRRFHMLSAWDFAEDMKLIAKEQNPTKKLIKLDWWRPLQDNKQVTFDYKIFLDLYNKMWKYIKDFQLKTCGDSESVRNLVRSVNKNETTKVMLSGRKAKKLNESHLAYYVELSRTKSLKQVYLDGFISRATYYRVKKQLEGMGLGDFNPDLAMGKPSIDYQEYKIIFNRYLV